MQKVVTIGGGDGQPQVLKALKHVADIEITSICTASDSGGSTGLLQKEYGAVGSIGDLTKCILALSDDATFVEALMYRYKGGSLDTQSVKNVLFLALEKVAGRGEALKAMWKLCGLGRHRVLFVTDEKVELHVRLQNGETVDGEEHIDPLAQRSDWSSKTHAITDVYLEPQGSVSPWAAEAIREADFVVVSPGDLYTSILPTLLPKGVQDAIRNAKAKIILFVNIMTKRGETDGYTAADFVSRIEERLGRKADYIIYNNAPIPAFAKATAGKPAGEKVELGVLGGDPRLIFAPLAKADGDDVMHDPAAIRTTLETIFVQ